MPSPLSSLSGAAHCETGTRWVTGAAAWCDLHVTTQCLSTPAAPDNLWSSYGPGGMLLEKAGYPSSPAQNTSRDSSLPYVFNDITTVFTLLVGIYFPSVTGRGRSASPALLDCL